MRPSCLQATSNQRGLSDRRAGTRPAVASALALHAACLGALVGLGYLRPVPPPQETVVELAIVPAPEPPAPPKPVEAAAAPAGRVLPLAAEPDPAPVETPGPPALEAPRPMPPPPAPEPAAVAAPMPPSMEVAPPRPMPPQSAHAPPRPPQHAATLPRAASPRQEAIASGAPASPAVAMLTAPAAFGSANQEATLEARIRDAVQAAVHYPASTRMMGITGRARLLLDYRSGNVAGPMLAQSSGTPTLDEAALAAARAAHYPPAPIEIEGRLLHLLVWVEFKPG